MQGPLRRADLGGEVGERPDVVAQQSTLGGEPVTGHLHTVAGVSGETDDDSVDLDAWLGHDPPSGSSRTVRRSRTPRPSAARSWPAGRRASSSSRAPRRPGSAGAPSSEPGRG